jgi:hypothetical protein
MEPVIKMHGQEDPTSSYDLKLEEPNRRFITSTSQLDTLAVLQFIKVRDQQGGTQDSIPVTHKISDPPRKDALRRQGHGNPSMHEVCTPRPSRPGTDDCIRNTNRNTCAYVLRRSHPRHIGRSRFMFRKGKRGVVPTCPMETFRCASENV